MCARGFDTEEHANGCAAAVIACVRELSRHIDLRGLDGITIASDYSQALLDLDRGYSTTHQLTPTRELALGIAMTPSGLREGKIKSHIVMDAGLATYLEDPENKNFGMALQMVAHECAHVEITQRFEDAFPNFLLRKACDNAHDAVRWQIILACWDEYAATNISAPFGQDPTSEFEKTFLLALNQTRAKANDFIRQYRLHRDVSRVMSEVYGAYGDLMKFGAYHLGNMAGRGLTLDDRPATKTALADHWFWSYFLRLDEICRRIGSDYGKWSDQRPFQAIGDLADEVVASGGLRVSLLRDGTVYVHVPLTPATVPA